MSFDRPFSSASVREMEQEFQRLMPSATSVTWRMLSGVKQGEIFDRVVVSRFEGTCEVQPLAHSRVKPEKLASTDSWENELLPFPDIDCDAIRKMLRPQFGSASTLRLRLLLGRAMGRILAHEVYHIELNTPLHSSSGLAKSAFAASELFAPRFGFAPGEMEQMTAMLAEAR